MPLILAIEPDRRQASQLTAMVRGRLHAELVLADSAETALAVLGDRVPDLILTSALLSTRDEAMLAERLRELDAAAAHVQTLTIPVLDTPAPRALAGRGVLFGLLGDREPSPAAPDGCDPAVFAEQCASYLERAATERDHQPVADEVVAPPVETDADPAPGETVEASPPPVVETRPPLVVETAPSLVALPPPVVAPPPRAAAPIEDGVDIDLSAMLDETVVHQLSEAIERVTRDGIHSSTWPAAAWLPPHHAAPDRRSFDAAPAPPLPRRFPERKPIQDEWGFFDPAQCGFAALLAKLDEITHVASSLPASDSPAGRQT